MGERGGEADQTRLFVDRGGLHCRDLVAAKLFAHDVESARKCGVAKGLIWAGGADGRNQRHARLASTELSG
jgi:aspartyl aminopeptidase